MEAQTVLNTLDKYFFKPLQELILGVLYSYGYFTQARLRYFSASLTVPLSGRNSGSIQIGNAPAVVERIFLTPTSPLGTLKISRSDNSEDLSRDPVPLAHIACEANEVYNGPPPFKVAANTSLGFEMTDTSGAENVLQITVMVRELV